MTSTTDPTPGTCKCGCGEPTPRNYRPGHDARHVGQLARAVAAGTTDKRAALKALPTEPLKAKFTKALTRTTTKAVTE